MSKFSFSVWKKLKFYVNYFYLRVISIWFEAYESRVEVFIYSLAFAVGNVLNSNFLKTLFLNSKVKHAYTMFGKFNLRPSTMDILIASPAYEREDVDYMVSVISKELEHSKTVIFLDIGADFGSYSVALGNKFAKNIRSDTFKIYAFEPDPESFSLLQENLKENNLEGKVFPIKEFLASENNKEIVYKFNTAEPGSSGSNYQGNQYVEKKFVTKTLDTVAGTLGLPLRDVVLVIKMDVEGSESEILKGAVQTISTACKTYLVVEDFVNPEIINYLQKSTQFQFVDKLTPYNSWWVSKTPNTPSAL